MKQETLKVNHRIRAESVMLIAEDGEQLGIKNFGDALKIALNEGLDLVEVSPNAKPPVCKIMDFGKYKYELEQKAKRARKHQSNVVIKEMKMRPKIDNHDYETKKKHVVKFLEHGNKVKITIMFRGREMVHPEIGSDICEQLAEDVSAIAFVESPAKQDGRNMIMVLAPIKITPEKKEAAEKEAAAEKALEMEKAESSESVVEVKSDDKAKAKPAATKKASPKAKTSEIEEQLNVEDVIDVDANLKTEAESA